MRDAVRNLVGGLEFFDPGPDTGGPGFANHIAATVTGGVTVNAVARDQHHHPRFAFDDARHPADPLLEYDGSDAGCEERHGHESGYPDGVGNGVLTVNGHAGASDRLEQRADLRRRDVEPLRIDRRRSDLLLDRSELFHLQPAEPVDRGRDDGGNRDV